MLRSIIPGLVGPATVVLTWTFLSEMSLKKVGFAFCASAAVALLGSWTALRNRSESSLPARPAYRPGSQPSNRFTRTICTRSSLGQPRFPALHRPTESSGPLLAEPTAITRCLRPLSPAGTF